MSHKVYSIIAENILKLAETQNILPWQKPWRVSKGTNGPHNHASKRQYSGINTVTLGLAAMAKGYASHGWLTYKQASEIGANVRKGEKGQPVVFFTNLIKEENGQKKRVFIARYYTVFNTEQCNDIPAVIPEGVTKEPITIHHDNAETVAGTYFSREKLTCRHGGQRACYSPALDMISMPGRTAFKSEAGYYSTLFHEMGHSTGHKNRLKRASLEKIAAFGDEVYSQEELVAEFTAAFLLGETGQQPEYENHAAYIQSWSSHILEKPQALVFGASQGEKAAKYILTGETPRYETEA